jgi:hypothetical protein
MKYFNLYMFVDVNKHLLHVYISGDYVTGGTYGNPVSPVV